MKMIYTHDAFKMLVPVVLFCVSRAAPIPRFLMPAFLQMRTHHLQDRGTWVRSYVGIILWTPFTVWKSNVTRNVSWCATREGSAEKSVRQEDQYILLTPVKQRNYLISFWTCDFAQLQRNEDSLMIVSFYWRLSTRSKRYIKTYIKMIWISLKEISTWSSTTQENQSIHYRYSWS